MTQAIALPTPALPPAAAPQIAGATVAASEGFAAALAQLLGLAVPSATVPALTAAHPHSAKSQPAAPAKTASTKSQPDGALIALPAAATPAPQSPAQLTASNSSQGNAATIAAATMQTLVSAPRTPSGVKPGEPTATTNGQAAASAAAVVQSVAANSQALTSTAAVAQSIIANNPATPPQTPLIQTALQLMQPTVQKAATVSPSPQTVTTNSDKTAPKPTSSKHTPAAAVSTSTDPTGTDAQSANQKSALDGTFAVITQRPGTQGSGSDGTQTAGGKTDPAVPQLTASAAPVVINLHTSANAQATNASGATPPVAIPVDALAINIARKFESGESRFEIRLDPIELGKLDISVTVGDDGRVQAIVRAERPETVDMLQRDARVLENQLRQSGLNVDSNSLSFSLGGGSGQRQALANGAQGFAQTLDTVPEIEPVKTASAIVSLRDGVDIRI